MCPQPRRSWACGKGRRASCVGKMQAERQARGRPSCGCSSISNSRTTAWVRCAAKLPRNCREKGESRTSASPGLRIQAHSSLLACVPRTVGNLTEYYPSLLFAGKTWFHLTRHGRTVHARQFHVCPYLCSCISTSPRGTLCSYLNIAAGASSLPASRPPRLLPIQKIIMACYFLARLQHYQVTLPHAAVRERSDCLCINLFSKCSACLQWHWIDPLSSFGAVLQKLSPICLSPTNSGKQYKEGGHIGLDACK